MRLGILTMSDKGSRGEREDTSGAAIRELMAPLGADICAYQVVPDEAEEVSSVLRAWCDSGTIDLILTTGGTGLAPRDITPEATMAVIDRAVPGIPERMRREGSRQMALADLSRAACGIRGRTLIVNLPGSERGVRESLSSILGLLDHAIATLQGAVGDH
jgi:molybdopterin adenylyltransferase